MQGYEPGIPIKSGVIDRPVASKDTPLHSDLIGDCRVVPAEGPDIVGNGTPRNDVSLKPHRHGAGDHEGGRGCRHDEMKLTATCGQVARRNGQI